MSVHLDFYLQLEGVIGTVDGQRAFRSYGLRATRFQSSGHPGGMKDGLRIFLTLQHGLVHPAIARGVAALAAGDIDKNFALRSACLGIEACHAALEPESSVDGVQGPGQGPVNLRANRFEMQGDVLWCGLRMQ